MIWLLLLAALIVLPFGVEAARRPMNARARARAAGQFAALSQGMTHYQWTGPETGPVVVCVHGLTTPSFVWDSIAQGLAAKGFRVLRYDLYGRGFSDRPPGVQSKAFFLQQLGDLLADQQVTGPVTVIGYSMGGVIATAFAASAPARVRQVVLLAPAGMQAVGATGFGALVRLPLVGRWLMLAWYPWVLRKGIRAEAQLPTSVPDITALQAKQLNTRGFIPAVHASLLGMLTDDFQGEHETLHRAGLPVLAIWGEDDGVIPLAAADQLTAWNPSAQNVTIQGAGHGLPYTHTAEVLGHTLPFLARGS